MKGCRRYVSGRDSRYGSCAATVKRYCRPRRSRILLQKKNGDLEDYTQLSAENVRLQKREAFLCEQLIEGNALLRALRQSPKYLKTQKERDAIIEAVNALYEDFAVRLSQRYPALTEEDLLICCLIKLRLNNQSIALLFGISPASVTKRKQRIKERMGWREGAYASFDLWLQAS